MPFISFIIPIKNRSDLFIHTVNSLLGQSNSDWEAIVVDDFSDAESYLEIELLCKKDERIKLYKRTGDKGGASICRNQGADYASAEIFVFLDSDDMIGTEFIENRIEAIKKYPNNEMWVFPVQVFYNKPGDSKLLWNIFNDNDDIDRFLNADVVWHTTSPVWEKQSFKKIGGFHMDLPCWQDWEIHLRALANNLNYQKINQTPDIFYRRHESDAISKHNISEKNLLGRFLAVKSIFYLFKEKQILSKNRNYLFAKLLINIYKNLYKQNHFESERILSFISKENILSGFELSIWKKRLKSKMQTFNKAIDKYIYKKYNDHFLDTKTSYLNVEL